MGAGEKDNQTGFQVIGARRETLWVQPARTPKLFNGNMLRNSAENLKRLLLSEAHRDGEMTQRMTQRARELRKINKHAFKWMGKSK